MTNLVEEVLNPKYSKTQLMDIYKGWSAKYEIDMEKDSYHGPEVASQALQSVIADKNARILDIGAGTGMLGTALKATGYTYIDALDANETMLDVARKLNVYKHFIVDFLAKNKLDIENETYDAVVGSGVFIPGHINEDCFDELCRITKPGGCVVLISNERYFEDKYHGYGQRLAAAIQEYESRGLWKIEKQESVLYHGTRNAAIKYLVVQ